MKSLLAKVYKKHSIWIEIVQSFGCNKDTSEDIVMEMYIKLKKNLDRGLVIDYTDDDWGWSERILCIWGWPVALIVLVDGYIKGLNNKNK